MTTLPTAVTPAGPAAPTPPSAEDTVAALLAAAGIVPSPEELAQFVADYPAHRANLDALFAVPTLPEEEPQLVFSPYV